MSGVKNKKKYDELRRKYFNSSNNTQCIRK